jgi:glycine/D-amino acid oxidase-like deaminating enzyme
MTRVLEDQTSIPETYARSVPDFHADELRESVTSDVVVVGAGYTGLSAAIHLGEASRSVVVLEARQVGFGGSSRAFGQVVPYSKHDNAKMLRHFGEEYGNRMVDGVGNGPEVVFDLIERYGIDCEMRKCGLMFAAHNPAAAASLAAKVSFLNARGVAVRMTDASETASLIGSTYYQTALVDPRGGTLNPLGYVRGLANAAKSRAARIFENSRALSISRQGDGWRIRTPSGQVDARFVILATDAYTDDLWPGLRQSLIPIRAYQLASEPLSDNISGSILPGGQSLTDTRRLYSGIRKRNDGRLHLSVDGPAFDNSGLASVAMAKKRVRDLFPQLGDLKWPDQVAGWVGMTTDEYPHLHRLEDGVFAAVGLNGRGIAFGTMLGREAAKRVLGKDESEMMLPLTPLKPIGVRPFARPLVGALINWYRMLDFIDIRGAHPTPPAN